MSKPAGLVRKKSAFFYVRRIPTDLRPLFENRQQLTIPLKTNDPRVAANRARAKAVEIDRQFQDARLGIPPSDNLDNGRATISQLENAARLHLFDIESSAERAPPTAEDQQYALELLMFLEGPEEGWGGSINKTAVSIAAKYQLRIAPGDRNWLEFITLVHRAEMEHARRDLDRARKVYGAVAHDVLFDDVHARKAPPKLSANKGITVDEVIRRFEADPIRAGLTESAAKKYIIPFQALREIAGDEAPVRAISRSQCAEMIEAIAALPANYTKFKEFKGKTFREIGELNSTLGKKRLSHGTVEVYAHHLSAFFNYAIQKGICETNPATRLVPKNSKTITKRLPFDTKEMNRMVAALPEWCDFKQGGRYWLPLIALFSGMRLGEIIWLRRSDIRLIDGVEAFVLERDEDRSLKTEGSARVIPLHPTLVELGLKKFADKLSGSERLFADLAGDKQQKAVDLFQKRFSYWAEKSLNVRDGVSFHSFRHSFRDATRNAGIPIDVIRALGGWSRGSAIEERYGQGTRPSVLASWLSKVDYPAVEFATLKQKMNLGAKIRPNV
jgi:integrase